MDLEYLVKKGIKQSEIRHKKRIGEIAEGITGRHKNILKFYNILKDSFKNYNYDYLIYLPCMPKSSAEIVSILSRNGERPGIRVPMSHEDIFDKIKDLNSLFDSNDKICASCDLASDKCEYYSGIFSFSEMTWKNEPLMIGNLLAEFIELSDMPHAHVFIKMLRIPQDSLLSQVPRYQIYNGLLIVTNGSRFDNSENALCHEIQNSYKNILKNFEKNLQNCSWDNLDVIDIDSEKKDNDIDYPKSLYPNYLPPKLQNAAINGDSEKKAILRDLAVEHSIIIKGDEIIKGDKYVMSGQAASIGPNAHVHNMNWIQLWEKSSENIELSKLADELEELRSKMRQEDATAEQDLAVGEVAKAQIAAKSGNGAKALEHLKAAGNKALSCAEKIGVPVAIAAIKASLGL